MQSTYYSLDGTKLAGKPDKGEYLEKVIPICMSKLEPKIEWFYWCYHAIHNLAPTFRYEYKISGGQFIIVQIIQPIRVKLERVSFNKQN